MKQKIFLGIGILICSIVGFSIYNEFMINHTYYYTMFGDRTNRKIIMRGIIALMIPLGYILRNKKFSLKKFLITWLPLGLTLFGIAHTIIKEGIIGSSGFVMLIINILLLYFLGIYLILGVTSVGHMINKLRIRLPQKRTQELFLSFGIGIGTFLILIKALASFTILYGAITRLIFLGLGVAIYFYRKELFGYQQILEENIEEFKITSLKRNPFLWIGLILIAISLLYYFYGFQLSFIPYSTAWDANHAYMYVPKVIAENHGVLRGNIGIAATPPELRHGFITFWFSLIGAIKGFWLGPDTVAVSMNFLSGIFVLILGLGTVKEIINYFTKKETIGTKIAFYLGRFLLLLWLTSGMGAFLVFVDNKTDLGVMALTILGMLSGFIFLNYDKEHTKSNHKETLKYIAISGVFFALATMAKPTAFIDIVLFGILLVALRINSIIAIGFGVIVVGMTGILQIANARDLINPETGKRVAIIGAIVVIIGILYGYFKKQFKNLKTTLINIGIWALGIIISLVLFKGTHLLYTQTQNNDFSVGNFAKALLLADNGDIQELQDQTTIDQQEKNNLSPEVCKIIDFSEEELEENKKEAIVGNEDVGRYVGYGRKEFSKGKGLNIGYGLLRLFYPNDNTCYGLNKNAKILCKNSDLILSFNIPGLKGILELLDTDSDSYKILERAIKNAEIKGQIGSIAEYRDEALMVKQYYENHSIKTENNKIFVPYRYIIPLNISFNRSLQNLSSYYTDIGFIWLFTMVFIILGLIYGFVKKDKTLISISSITILGWAIWWMIGGGILWYGLGLVIWTILASIMYINELTNDSTEDTDKNILYFFLFLFAIWGIIQLFFNFIRISSQGSGGPFAWYKMNTGKSIEIDSNLQQKESVITSYNWKDVFDLQFPHYNKFIELVKDRPDKDGVMIAGTYIQYFLHNQRNIKLDGMLGRLREEMSDNDSCKTVHRLKNQNIKYLVVDPNIGTVGMGEGNETLFHRFFAKLDSTNKIESHGVISMLMKMKQEGFLKLISTNNLGTKYALEIEDEKFREYFGQNVSDEDLILIRSKLAVARYFPDANNYINFIANIFIQRIISGEGVGDIADVYGKIIDEQKTKAAINTLLESGQVTPQLLQQTTENLTQDERLIIAQYISISNLQKANNERLQEAINGILGQSLGGSSQIIVLEIL
ncbi:MAG: hypothetical protein PHR61_03350 [Candidatus Absconditabacteria bacterium]|nr:hypothetical protein [Candidatus Absconditabacteria bacterium]